VRYEWEETITIDLPEGWTLNEPGDVIEVVPPDDSGAIHISIFDRDRPESPSIKEASELVAWFHRRRGAAAKIETFRDESGVPAARSRFTAAQDGKSMAWRVQAKIWPAVAVLATYVHDPRVKKHAAVVDATLSSIDRIGRNV
jgi:hypothetical protein